MPIVTDASGLLANAMNNLHCLTADSGTGCHAYMCFRVTAKYHLGTSIMELAWSRPQSRGVQTWL